MSDHTVTSIFASIQNAISEIANVEPDEVNLTDHLERDFYLQPTTDIPRLLSVLSQDLEHDFDPDTIEEFVTQCREDEEKATISELLAYVEEEVEFS